MVKHQAEKRAHHNALERKRRDHIKGSFKDLRDAIPLLKGEKVKTINFLFPIKIPHFSFPGFPCPRNEIQLLNTCIL